MRNKNIRQSAKVFYGGFALFLIAALAVFLRLQVQAADPEPGLDIPSSIDRDANYTVTVYGAAPNKPADYTCTSPSGKDCGGFVLCTTDANGTCSITRKMLSDQEIGQHEASVKVGTATSATVIFSVLGSGGDTVQWPVLPAISKVELGSLHFVGYETRIPDENRMSTLDSRDIKIYDAQGNPYPTEVKNSDGSIRASVTINITLRRGDGQLCNSIVFAGGCALGAWNITNGIINIGTPPGNGSACVVSDNGVCGYPLDQTDLVRGAAIPGDVILEKVAAEAYAYANDTEQKIASTVFAPSLKLFRVADPPKINTLSKASAKHNETITTEGLNFDSGGAGEWLWANKIVLDLNRDTLKGGRVINSVSGTEDLVHYCSRGKIKFEIPTDVATGKHTVTLSNDWGYSNTVDLDVLAGSGTPENDPACAVAGKITSISPTLGAVGTKVTITGKNLGSATSGSGAVEVKVNNTIVPAESISYPKTDGTQAVIYVPTGATTGRITVKPASRGLITGPTFTVTTGTDGGGGDEEELDAQSVSPDDVYLNDETDIIIEGTGFGSDTALTTDNPSVTVSDVAVNTAGTALSATLDATGASAGALKLIVSSGGDSASITANLAIRDPGAPDINSVTVNPTEKEGEVSMVLTGTNFESVTAVSIRGSSSLLVRDFTVSANEILAAVTVLDFNPDIFGITSLAFAATRDEVLAGATNPDGSASKRVPADSFQAQANDPNTYVPAEDVKTGFETICNREAGLAPCIQKIYLFSLGLGALIAMFMVVLAGYRYMTAQGNAEQVESAKGAFASAFIGLIIIFIAFILLYLINPDLVKFKKLELPPINTGTRSDLGDKNVS